MFFDVRLTSSAGSVDASRIPHENLEFLGQWHRLYRPANKAELLFH
jgi:hypothetical protein